MILKAIFSGVFLTASLSSTCVGALEPNAHKHARCEVARERVDGVGFVDGTRCLGRSYGWRARVGVAHFLQNKNNPNKRDTYVPDSQRFANLRLARGGILDGVARKKIALLTTYLLLPLPALQS